MALVHVRSRTLGAFGHFTGRESENAPRRGVPRQCPAAASETKRCSHGGSEMRMRVRGWTDGSGPASESLFAARFGVYADQERECTSCWTTRPPRQCTNGPGARTDRPLLLLLLSAAATRHTRESQLCCYTRALLLFQPIRL